MTLKSIAVGATLFALIIIALFVSGLRLTPTVLRNFDPQAATIAADTYDVEITRDTWGIPRIIGKTEADAAFGLAYAHAEDDFETIEEALRVSLGPDMLANGESEIKMAYLIQALGILETVEEKYTDLEPRTRAYVEAYARGLNLYAAHHPGEASSDLFPVTGQDIVALSSFFSPLFYGMSSTLTKLVAEDTERDVAKGQELQVLLRDASRYEIGSNAIAIAPSRSADGVTRLIINSHQPVDGPLAWYEAHLLSEDGFEFAGGAFPGGPFLHLGGNTSFGQAATVNSPDLIDVYALEEREGGYVLDGEVRSFEIFEAEILAHLFGPFAWRAKRTVERSVHGPVFRNKNGAFALRYATMDTLGAIDAGYAMMRARSVNEFEAALARGEVGATNRIVADTGGRIARYYNARMPKRPQAMGIDWEGYLPGNRAELVWEDFEPFAALPHMVDPQAGYVVESNHTPFIVTLGSDDLKKADYPSEFGIESVMTNRALRATQLMAEDEDGLTTRDELLAVKYDDRYHEKSLAMELRRELLAMSFGGNERLIEGLDMIQRWNGQADETNREAAVALMTFQPIGFALFLDQEPPALKDSFKEAVAYLDTHHGRLDVPWGEVNLLKRGEHAVGLGGGPDTLRAVNSAPDGQGALEMVSGDGLTMLWEAAPGEEARLYAVHQYGASARPGSTHFADQMTLFAEEGFREVPLGIEAVRAAAENTYRPQQMDPR